jgi:predicted DNA-binding transcriptional regulator YafY
MRAGVKYGLFQDLLNLAIWLHGHRDVTISDIAERYGVARRTAERMRDTMADVFGESFKERKDGPNKYFRIESRRLDTLIINSITEEELASMTIAQDLLTQHNLTKVSDDLKNVQEKVKNLLNLPRNRKLNLEDLLKTEGLAMRPGPTIKYDTKIISTITEALLSFHQLKIVYKGVNQPYSVDLIPLGVLYGERRHYLVAKYVDGWTSEPRHYILDKIVQITLLEETFEEDPDFDLQAHAAKSFGAFQEEQVDVEWLFSPLVANEAVNFIFHPSQTTKRNRDGSLTVKFRCGGRLEMSWHLYTWGDQVKVIKPVNFWESLRDEY